MKVVGSEHELHKLVCKYLKMQYKGVIFKSDHEAGRKRNRWEQANIKIMQSERGYPDLFIAEPVGVYHGLYLELKRDDTRILLQNGTITKDKHIREQLKLLEQLASKGYACAMTRGFDQTKFVIDQYMQGRAIAPVLAEFMDALARGDIKADDELPF